MNTVDQLLPGTRVRVVQRIDRRQGAWTTEVEGVVESVSVVPTGSWFAHGASDRYLLKRIRLRKDDGEISVLSLDEDSQVYVLAPAP